MSTISAIKISKSFSAKNIFENISITINSGDKVAIIGENGVGKSTLLQILCGLQKPDTGTIQCEDWITKRYSTQEPIFDKTTILSDILTNSPDSIECLRLMRLFGLNIDEPKITKVKSLSFGQQKILDLAYHISHAPEFLFIDEPENHLDIVARKKLGEFLTTYWGAVFFVSHDCQFINNIATKIIEIENHEIRVVNGSYEDYIAQRELEFATKIRKWQAEKRDVERLQKSLHILQMRAKEGTKGSGTYQSKKREVKKRKKELGHKLSSKRSAVKLQLNDVTKKNGKQIIACNDISFHYSDNPKDTLFANVNLYLQFGEKVALLGRNGTGKSTFINILQRVLEPTTGTYILGNDINVNYFDQVSPFNEDLTALKIAIDTLNCHEEIARHLLAQILFNRDEITLPIHMLSSGQKNRLRISLLFAQNPELIILDEPTNNLDPTTWGVLVTQIQNYQGTLLIISHDQMFLDQINFNKFWVFKNHSITECMTDLPKILNNL